MREKKEPLVIDCTSCEARFRLWIPSVDFAEWEKGSSISCIKCGATYQVKKTGEGFVVESAAAPASRFESNAFAIDSHSDGGPLILDESSAETGSAAGIGAVSLSADEASAPPTLPTILVVEDDALSRKMLENTLRDVGRRLVLVKNGAEALQILREESIDLLVVDLYLKNPDDPGSLMDGEEVLGEVLRMELKIPAIVTTGKELVDDISLDPKWFNYNVKDFIQKGNPFWVDELKVKVTDIIAKR
ncbi:MAG: response regulator [Thermodesulfobacteriota bacterium]